MKKIKRNSTLLAVISVVAIGFLLPESFTMPVEGADRSSYHSDSFWFYPWGKSITHKGVDIFAKQGKEVRSSVSGIVIFSGNIDMGGNVVFVLGPKWKIHYYAHLKESEVPAFFIVYKGSKIGSVGNTGNAIGKPPHLHYAIVTLFPYLWLADQSIEGWKKIFYLNPIPYLKGNERKSL
ncbi:M23 family metallopeptidase [Leptospira borgpetersenii]|uniref:M23 family metallopeptidase n=1 Tax=Leptospira borgpetersenii TaxID=174 RepID=UPI0003485062|nr:M23 family metallopeptidase [Leptospira borgpetersenii]URD70876.1 M23 family metallopeptidase [Leptospira borgpetersenii]UVD74055.1 M23 family metallopeptidase [Leptospira borgpetersenii]UVD77251.1 M23 family metallopeptidase [Leptospira borgpetersenii]UZW33814.1 M23 family metallopeptidase [Leptospira borgpetersenii]